MKAVGLLSHGGAEVLQVLDLPMPDIGPAQVVIRVLGTSVNYADIQTRRGAYHAGGTQFPLVPGLDALGRIEAIGSAVTRLNIGQRVIAFPHSGSYAQFIAADEALTFPVPEDIPFEQAAACPLVAFTARMLLTNVARLAKGETVLIHAASGGIGTTAIQIAKALGAKRIIGTVGSEAKAAAAREAGADLVLNHRDDWVQAVKDAVGTVDVLLDSLGGDYTAQGLQVLAPYGRLVAFGSASGCYCDVSTGLLHASCRSLLGFSIGSTRRLHPDWFEGTARAVFGLMTSGQLTVRVSRVLPLEQAAEAHRAIERGDNTGKIVLDAREGAS